MFQEISSDKDVWKTFLWTFNLIKVEIRFFYEFSFYSKDVYLELQILYCRKFSHKIVSLKLEQ